MFQLEIIPQFARYNISWLPGQWKWGTLWGYFYYKKYLHPIQELLNFFIINEIFFIKILNPIYLKKKKKKTKSNRLEFLILCNYHEIVKKKTGNFDDFTETIYTEIWTWGWRENGWLNLRKVWLFEKVYHYLSSLAINLSKWSTFYTFCKPQIRLMFRANKVLSMFVSNVCLLLIHSVNFTRIFQFPNIKR